MASLARACGALGPFDRDRVLRMARALDREPAIVHEDDRSILALDREPIRWSAGKVEGLAWSELVSPPAASSIRSWQDAAQASAACGLVLAPGDRFVHSSVSGIAPVYYLAADGAVYFASSVHALVASGTERLSIDWEAWASILTLNHPLGERTPFAEIRRLGPSSLLHRRGRGAHASVERWPWADVEAGMTVEEGVGDLVARMRSVFARLPSGPIVCPLSGGWDSRICLALLLERPDVEVRTMTTNPDSATDREQRNAAVVAAAAGVPHEVVGGDDRPYFDDVRDFAQLLDFQMVRKPWRMQLLDPFREAGAPVVDGLALDTFALAGDRFFGAEALASGGSDAAVDALWTVMEQKQARREPPLRPRLLRALWASAKRQHMTTSERFRGHDYRAVLTFYLGRTRRGIGQVSHALLGSEAPIALPFVDDEVVRANLAIAGADKLNGRLYRSLFATIGTGLGKLPSNRVGSELPGEPHAQRSQTAAAADAIADSLADGPFAPYIPPGAMRELTRHRRGRPPRVHVSVMAPVFFHLWCARYGDRVGDVDPGPVFLG